MTTPKFDNYTIDGEQVINCDKTVDIPYDYDGYIATPITALDKSFRYSGLGMQLLFAEVEGGGINAYQLITYANPWVKRKEIYKRLIWRTIELGHIN